MYMPFPFHSRENDELDAGARRIRDGDDDPVRRGLRRVARPMQCGISRGDATQTT